MRGFAAAIVTLMALSVGCARIDVAAAAGQPPLLAVVTWNMNAGRGDLPRLIADLESGRLTGAPPAGYVLLLQEATAGNHLPVIRSTRPLSSLYVPLRHDGRVLRGNAIVATMPLAAARTIALPRERQTRTAVAAIITVAGDRLFVASVHLENRASWLRGGVLDESARGRQAEALLRALPAGPGVVGGDMNTWLGPTEPAWRTFARRFPADQSRPSAAIPTFRDRAMLDHLFYELPAQWNAAQRVLASRYGSDHHPVLATISHAHNETQAANDTKKIHRHLNQ